MRVVLCWGVVSGYMAACWRELSRRDGIDLLVLNPRRQKSTAFDDETMAGINHRLLDEPSVEAYLAAIKDHGADVISVSGWMYPAFVKLAADKSLQAVPFIMSMDTPLRRDWRQQVGRIRLKQYFARMAAVVVAGERSWQYARYLGFREQAIHRGVYGYDEALFRDVARVRDLAGGWPRAFLYVGRYASEKGIDVLVNAYRLYRKRVREPWPLTCHGLGPLDKLLVGQPGIRDAGFAQPGDQPGIFAKHGVLVLPSLYEPWGVVLAEAGAAGMASVCTEACGAAVELVRDGFNGFITATNDVESLTAALSRAHERYAELPEMGMRAQQFAAAYSSTMWANRWQHLSHNLLCLQRGNR